MKRLFKVLMVALLLVASATTSVNAEENNSKVVFGKLITEGQLSRSGFINDVYIEEYQFDDSCAIQITDKAGNNLFMDSINNYFYYNDEIVYYSIDVDTIIYCDETTIWEEGINSKGYNDPYVLVSTQTVTYQQSVAISTLASDILGSALNWKLGIALAVYNAVITYYSSNSPSATVVYVRTDKYAYRPVLSTFYHHDYGLDVNYNKIPNTDHFDNNGLKTFLGY